MLRITNTACRSLWLLTGGSLSPVLLWTRGTWWKVSVDQVRKHVLATLSEALIKKVKYNFCRRSNELFKNIVDDVASFIWKQMKIHLNIFALNDFTSKAKIAWTRSLTLPSSYVTLVSWVIGNEVLDLYYNF